MKNRITVLYLVIGIIFSVFNPNLVKGQKLLWVNNCPATGATAEKVFGDDNGNICVYGQYNDSIIFNENIKLKALTNPSCYVAWYDKYGKCKWAYSSNNSSGTTSFYGLFKGCEGNIYLHGRSDADVYIGKRVWNFSSKGDFIAKLDKNGDIAWVTKAPQNTSTLFASKGRVIFTNVVKGDADSVNLHGYYFHLKSGWNYNYIAAIDSVGKMIGKPNIIAKTPVDDSNTTKVYEHFRIHANGMDNLNNFYFVIYGYFLDLVTAKSYDTGYVGTQKYPLNIGLGKIFVKVDSNFSVLKQNKMENAFNCIIDKFGNIYTIDSLKVQRYDSSFKKQTPIKFEDNVNLSYIASIAIGGDGHVFENIRTITNSNPMYNCIQEFDSSGKILWKDTLLAVNWNFSESNIFSIYADGRNNVFFAGSLEKNSKFIPANLPNLFQNSCALFGMIGHQDTSVAGINVFNKLFNCSIYPNPANDILNIRLNSTTAEIYSYSIQSMDGKEINSGKLKIGSGLNTFSLPLFNIAKGMYILSLQNNDGFQRAKFFKE